MEKQPRKVRRKRRRKKQKRRKRQLGPSQVQAKNGSRMRPQMKQQLLKLRKLSSRPPIRFQKGRREKEGRLPLSEGSGRRRLRWTLEWRTIPLMPSEVQLETGGSEPIRF